MEKLFELLESPEAGVVEDVKCLIDQQVVRCKCSMQNAEYGSVELLDITVNILM